MIARMAVGEPAVGFLELMPSDTNRKRRHGVRLKVERKDYNLFRGAGAAVYDRKSKEQPLSTLTAHLKCRGSELRSRCY